MSASWVPAQAHPLIKVRPFCVGVVAVGILGRRRGGGRECRRIKAAFLVAQACHTKVRRFVDGLEVVTMPAVVPVPRMPG